MKPSKQIAKNYSQALKELTGNDLSLLESFLAEIEAINKLINEVSGAKSMFENPIIPKNEKKELLKKLFQGKINQKILNFLFLLIDKQRFNALSEIQNQLAILVNKAKGITIAEVASASELDSTTLENIKQRLENILGQNGQKEKVTIEQKIEVDLIGGIKVKINDLVYDGSLKGRLENLKRRLG